MSLSVVPPITGSNGNHHHCSKCSRPPHDFFCNLAGQELRLFESLKIRRDHPKGKVLFVEGQPAEGVHILCSGRVKLSACSPTGKIIILTVAEPGEVLGLSAVITDYEYSCTAETLESCLTNFVPKADFINYLRQNPEAGLSAARQLAQTCYNAQKMTLSFGLSDSVIVKLSKLFLSWSTNTLGIDGSLRLNHCFTHEEMAEMVGSTRETVTRALGQMRERGLVTAKGSTLIIHDPASLRSTAGLISKRNVIPMNGNGSYAA